MTQKLFILSPEVVFAARVNQSTFTYPLDQVTFDTVTVGAYTDIKPGMTVLLGNSTGADNRGRQRVRKAAAVNTLYVGRSSRGVRDGELNLADNQYITVIDDRRVWAKIPYIDESGVIYKDSEIVYSDQNEETPPKANIYGGAVAATIDGSDIITVMLNGSASYPVADGATLTGYAWDVGDGTITAGTGTSIITAEFPAGKRYVSLTVTDSNSKTHTTEILVYAHDPDASECVAFEITEHRITQQGQQLSFRILEDIPLSTYPDGTLVILWDGEPFDESDRSNVKFWGWIQSEQLSVAAERTATLKDITIQCVDIPGRLATLPGFSQSIIGDSTPESWLEMAAPNMDKFIDYLLRWHSTAFEVGFYRPSGTGSDYPFVILESAGENLWSQAAAMAKALVPDYIMGANSNGEIWTWPDPMLQDTRTSTVQAALSEGVYTAVNWERMRPPRSHWLWEDAIDADPTVIAALFSTSPGQSPGQGETSQQAGRQLAQSQDDLNSCAGHRYARMNALHGLIPITMITDVGIEPSNMTWITLTLNSAYSRRQAGFTAARGLPIEVNITYNYSRTGVTKTVEVLFEEETSGTAAVTYIPPDPDWDPPYEPPIEPPQDPPDPTSEGDGLGTFYGMTADVLARTRDLSAASPSYVAMKTAGGGEDFYSFILDPFDPIHNGFLLGSDGLYRSTDLDQSTPGWTLIYDVADMEAETGVSGTLFNWFKIVGTIKKQGFFAFGVWDHDNGPVTYGKVWVFVTEDSGDTWTAHTAYSATGATAGTMSEYYGAISISDSELGPGGEPIIAVVCGKDASIRCRLSENGGATWSQTAAGFITGNGFGVSLHLPYNANSDTTKFLLACSSAGTLTYTYYKSTNQGASWTPITLAALISKPGFNRTKFESWTQNYQQVYAFGTEGMTPDSRRFYVSSDFAANWTLKKTFATSVGASGGFPYNGGQFYIMTTQHIWLTLDGGDNWLDKTGNWSWGFNFVADVGGVTVPVWVIE
jgi:hypothetical protein